MNKKFSMVAGIAIFAVALGLSLQNAFNGYGVKSGSIHPEILAQTNTGGGTGTGTGTGTGSGSGSGTGTGTGNGYGTGSGDITSGDIGSGATGRYSYPTGEDCEYKKMNDNTVYKGTWYGCKTGEHSCTTACVGKAN
jgi:hypothetical protein